jgi:hypothetical protein
MSSRKSTLVGIWAIMLLVFGSIAMAEDFTATTIGNYDNVTVMEFTGNYDTPTLNNPDNAIPRQVIAKDFLQFLLKTTQMRKKLTEAREPDIGR